ncbi:DUF2079 domain-containing protein [Ktedonosporobacter rubrisoli]|uniref:DUF2079 domain-containing protein n=1 Tax=Ktedonosporobacter rubrisoli TaxID=2509675 RepID=A0A4P6JY21_KTERU|nr:DUF2079 domain-containing protein [Ktedonosporobacter rubrisoli]QBD80679.1 DUF2079 domain-containing protein [Ktedonosporobacter rubrisoli]
MRRLKLNFFPFTYLSRLTPAQIAWGLLALAMLCYAARMSQLTVLRYDTFKATAFDLGNMDQVLWNTIHGRPFQFTNQGDNWYGPPTRLAFHIEPILLPLSLLYVFGADPRILLIFQSVALASGALPIFLLMRKQLPRWPLLAAAMACTYLLMPALLGVNAFDFHPVSIATPLLLYAMLAFSYRRYGWFLLACILAASTKEDVPFAVGLLGLLIILKYKMPRLGTLLFVGGFCWGLLAFIVIMPHFYPGGQHNNFWYRYEALGSTPGAAIINILLHPWLLFTTFITLDRLYYLAGIFRSSGFLALLAPEMLLPTLPSFAVNLLSTDPILYSGAYQYNAPIIPFVMLAAIEGAGRLARLWCQWRGEPFAVLSETQEKAAEPQRNRLLERPWPAFMQRALLWGQTTLAASIAQPALARPVALLQPRISSLVHTGSNQWERFSECMIPFSQTLPLKRLQWYLCAWLIAMCALNFFIVKPALDGFWPDHKPGSREAHMQQLLAMIPPDASVSAGTNLNPHLTDRLYVTVFPSITFSTSNKNINNTVDYVIVDLNAVFPEDKDSTANVLNQLVRSRQFCYLRRAEGVVLLVKHSVRSCSAPTTFVGSRPEQ